MAKTDNVHKSVMCIHKIVTVLSNLAILYQLSELSYETGDNQCRKNCLKELILTGWFW
jgi:hypothetical protein